MRDIAGTKQGRARAVKSLSARAVQARRTEGLGKGASARVLLEAKRWRTDAVKGGARGQSRLGARARPGQGAVEAVAVIRGGDSGGVERR